MATISVTLEDGSDVSALLDKVVARRHRLFSAYVEDGRIETEDLVVAIDTQGKLVEFEFSP